MKTLEKIKEFNGEELKDLSECIQDELGLKGKEPIELFSNKGKEFTITVVFKKYNYTFDNNDFKKYLESNGQNLRNAGITDLFLMISDTIIDKLRKN